MALCLGKFKKKNLLKPSLVSPTYHQKPASKWDLPSTWDLPTTVSFLDQGFSVASAPYDNLTGFNTSIHQEFYPFDYPNYFLDEKLYPSAPHLNPLVPFDGGITGGSAPNHFPVAPIVSNPTAPRVSNVGPWDLLSPGFLNPGPSVSGLTAAYLSDNGPWASPSPDFSNRHAPQATVDHSFCPIPNNHNSTSSPYASNSYTADSSGDMERMAETSQPILNDGTNLTAPSANTGRQRVMKPRPICKTCHKSFSRPSDLDRHAKKHQPGARIHMCSVPGCDYEGSYRKDKLTAHVKNCHK